jgi:hypothetical protein
MKEELFFYNPKISICPTCGWISNVDIDGYWYECKICESHIYIGRNEPVVLSRYEDWEKIAKKNREKSAP